MADDTSDLELQVLYIALAKRCHPDIATTPAQRAHFGELMVRINLAREQRNVVALRTIARELEGKTMTPPPPPRPVAPKPPPTPPRPAGNVSRASAPPPPPPPSRPVKPLDSFARAELRKDIRYYRYWIVTHPALWLPNPRAFLRLYISDATITEMLNLRPHRQAITDEYEKNQSWQYFTAHPREDYDDERLRRDHDQFHSLWVALGSVPALHCNYCGRAGGLSDGLWEDRTIIGQCTRCGVMACPACLTNGICDGCRKGRPLHHTSLLRH